MINAWAQYLEGSSLGTLWTAPVGAGLVQPAQAMGSDYNITKNQKLYFYLFDWVWFGFFGL